MPNSLLMQHNFASTGFLLKRRIKRERIIMRTIFCVVVILLLIQGSVLSAEFLFTDDFENPKDFDKKWLTISNWELKEEKGNHFAEKLDEQGQVDLEVKDMTFTAPFTVQMRLKQVNADAGAHIAIHVSRAPFEGYIYGFNATSVIEWNPISGAREEFKWNVGPDTWVTYKILAEERSAKCYYRIEGEKDFTLSHDKDDVGIKHKDVFIGLWVGTVVQVDDVYIWEGVDKSLEDVFAVCPEKKLASSWVGIKTMFR
jgi:hypothetical protein